jgi:hypothetical protein
VTSPAAASASTHYDLTTVAGRAAYLTTLAERAVLLDRLTIEWRVWQGHSAARLYVADYYVSIDDEGDLTYGGRATKYSTKSWDKVEASIIDDCSFTVGGITSSPSTAGKNSCRSCRECRGTVQSWSDGLSRGLCHDCA